MRFWQAGPVSSLFFLPSGRELVSAEQDHIVIWDAGTAKVWDVKTKRELQRRDHAGQVSAVAVSRNGERLATACDDGCVRIWDKTMDHELSPFTYDGEANTIAFAPDGKTLAAGGSDDMVILWKIPEKPAKNAHP